MSNVFVNETIRYDSHRYLSHPFLLFSAVFLAFRHKWSYIFNNDPGVSYTFHVACKFDIDCSAEVVSLVASILPLVALFQVFDATSGVVGGIFRARGKQVSRCTH